MSGEYKVKESVLKKYHLVASYLLIGFDKVQVKQLSRKDSICVDVLSKLVSLFSFKNEEEFYWSIETPRATTFQNFFAWIGNVD